VALEGKHWSDDGAALSNAEDQPPYLLSDEQRTLVNADRGRSRRFCPPDPDAYAGVAVDDLPKDTCLATVAPM
jgi:hypothetical protein